MNPSTQRRNTNGVPLAASISAHITNLSRRSPSALSVAASPALPRPTSPTHNPEARGGPPPAETAEALPPPAEAPPPPLPAGPPPPVALPTMPADQSQIEVPVRSFFDASGHTFSLLNTFKDQPIPDDAMGGPYDVNVGRRAFLYILSTPDALPNMQCMGHLSLNTVVPETASRSVIFHNLAGQVKEDLVRTVSAIIDAAKIPESAFVGMYFNGDRLLPYVEFTDAIYAHILVLMLYANSAPTMKAAGSPNRPAYISYITAPAIGSHIVQAMQTVSCRIHQGTALRSALGYLAAAGMLTHTSLSRLLMTFMPSNLCQHFEWQTLKYNPMTESSGTVDFTVVLCQGKTCDEVNKAGNGGLACADLFTLYGQNLAPHDFSQIRQRAPSEEVKTFIIVYAECAATRTSVAAAFEQLWAQVTPPNHPPLELIILQQDSTAGAYVEGHVRVFLVRLPTLQSVVQATDLSYRIQLDHPGRYLMIAPGGKHSPFGKCDPSTSPEFLAPAVRAALEGKITVEDVFRNEICPRPPPPAWKVAKDAYEAREKAREDRENKRNRPPGPRGGPTHVSKRQVFGLWKPPLPQE